MSTVNATFKRWAQGWEITLEGHEEVSTQAATLDDAPRQVRDYLDTIDPEVDHSAWHVILTPSAREQTLQTLDILTHESRIKGGTGKTATSSYLAHAFTDQGPGHRSTP